MHKNNRMLALLAGLFVFPLAHAQAESPVEAADPAVAVAQEEEETYVADIDGESGRDSRKGLGVGLRVSTLGAGVELIYSLNKNFNLRGQGNFIALDETVEEDGVKYDGKLDFQTLGLLVDYHPFAGSFRISAGAFQNGNEIKLDAACPSGCEVGDLTITSNGATPAKLSGKIDFNSTAPYAGIGFGNAMKGWPVHFAFDVGVLFQGSPKVDLSAAGSASVRDNTQPAGPGNPQQVNNVENDATVQQAVADEEQNLQREVNDFKLYPVVSFTIGYRFSF